MRKEQETVVGRREFLNKSVMAAVGISGLGSWSKPIGTFTHNRPLSSQSKGAVHNMLVLGTKTIYLYHLPMFSFPGFDSPHRYQVILEVTLTDHEKYLSDRQDHKDQKIYTFNPEKFVLTELKARSAFKGTIFRGHLEKSGGEPLSEGVTATVKRVVYSQEFKSKAKRSSKLEYILFGRAQELFMAHLITRPPDFDQILSVRIPGREPRSEPTDAQLETSVRLTFPKITNSIDKRIKERRRIKADLPEIPIWRQLDDKVDIATEGKSLQLISDAEIYFEEGELRTPPAFATTPAEKAAGFP